MEAATMTLRCVLDGLLLPARLRPGTPPLVAWDGDEPFGVEALEARYYEVVCATEDELLRLEAAHYRLLRRAGDFRCTRGRDRIPRRDTCQGGRMW
jgi:hypothetical protein